MDIFKGFNLKYRSYHVITPQTGLLFDVRGLTVSEVDKIRNSSLIPSKIRNVINDILWSTIQEKPKHIKTFVDFKKGITIKDREALLYGVYHSTWPNDKEFTSQCSSCGKEQILRVHIDKMFSFNPYPFSENYKDAYKLYRAGGGVENIPELDNFIITQEAKDKEQDTKKGKLELNQDLVNALVNDEDPVVPPGAKKKKEKTQSSATNKFDILSKRVELRLPESGVYVILKQPTIFDEEVAYLSSPFNQKNELDTALQTLIIDRFEERFDDGSVNIVDNRADIVYGFQSLPVLDRREIISKFFDEFGKYGIELKTNWNCEECGEPNVLQLNIAAQFFRMVHNEL
jgi:hypothetical protein